jgi:hypothetical protein
MLPKDLMYALLNDYGTTMSYRSCDAIIEYIEQNNIDASTESIYDHFAEYQEWELYRKYPIDSNHKSLDCPHDCERMYFYNYKYPYILAALVKEKYNLTLVKYIPMIGVFLVLD